LGVVNGKKQIYFAGGDGILYAFEALSTPSQNKQIKKLDKIWWFDGDPNAPKENVHQFIKNRVQSPSNIKSMPVVFQNKIYLTLGGDIWWGKRKAWLKCVDAMQMGDITGKGEIWSYPLERHVCSTPSVFKNMVFVTDLGNNIHCVDASTGKPFWVHHTSGDFWASTLVADEKVYAGNRRGELYILEASENKKLISSIKLDSPISATPVVANGVLYIATNRSLYAIQKE
jgi:outer membrane protein assembly factor BamB